MQTAPPQIPEQAGATASAPPPDRTGPSLARDLFSLTKPGIVFLVLVTTYAGMWLANPGNLPAGLVLWTMLGTAMAASASAVINNVWDRDIDIEMRRTALRPTAAGRVGPRLGYGFAATLAVAALIMLWGGAGALPAALALIAILVYGGAYTMWLKRRSHLCTDFGGIAGAMPPLIGWAAVTGELGAPAWALFAMLIFWQPPHFWALAVVKVEEYRKVGVPMLPVVRGVDTARNWMLVYTAALVGSSMVPFLLGRTGLWYPMAAAGLGAIYLIWTWQFRVRPVTLERARGLFFYSMIYLFVLLLVLIADARPVSPAG